MISRLFPKAFIPSLLFCLVLLIGLASLRAEEELVKRVSYFQQAVPMQQVQKDNTIVGADDYMTLFIWKSLNISSLEELYQVSNSKNLRFFSYTYNTTVQSRIMKDTIPSASGMLQNNFFFSTQISNSWKYQRVSLGRSTDCLRGSILENFDILIDTPQIFAKRIRLDRSHTQRKKKSPEYLDMTDFNIIPLFPTSFWVVENTKLAQNLDKVSEEMYNIMLRNTTMNLTCLDSIIHDSRVLERYHGVINFTMVDLEMTKSFLNISQQFHYNYGIVNSVLNRYKSSMDNNWLNSPFYSIQQIEGQLWPSSCHYCTTPSCVGEKWTYVEYLDMTVVAIGIVFYIILFTTKLFMNPVFKRRLGLSFVGPLLNMSLFLSLSTAIVGGCVTFAALTAVYSATCLIMLYVLTVVRYYYLRNLYWILEKTKNSKIHKILTNYWFGIVITISLPFVFSVIFLIPEIALFETWIATNWDLSVNLTILIMAAFSCIMGVCCIVLDLWVNRKSIKEKGLRNFFFFQDPLYVRIDLVSMVLIIIFLIWIVIDFVAISSSTIGIFRFLIGLFVYMILGGNSMIIVLVEHLSFKSSKGEDNTSTSAGDECVDLLDSNHNQGFYNLFREYCIHENSLENIILLDTLRELRAKNSIKIKDMKQIQEKHLQTFSKYEVNISHEAKSKFIALIRDLECVTDKSLPFSDLEYLRTEIIFNIKDSFSRFRKTPNFREWKRVHKIQQQNRV